MDDNKPILRIVMDHAISFTLHKNRMPKDVHELRDWLREFAEWEHAINQNLLNAFHEHMSTCTHPVFLPNLPEPRP